MNVCLLFQNSVFDRVMDCSHSDLDTKAVQAKQYGPLRGYDRGKKIVHILNVMQQRDRGSAWENCNLLTGFGFSDKGWLQLLYGAQVCFLKSSFTVLELYSVKSVLLSEGPLPFSFPLIGVSE